MDVAGLLLTGGASRRMGRAKADLPVGATTLARRLGGLLRDVCAGPALEVGPGRSGLPAVGDEVPGAGPLAAVATGAGALASRRWDGPALVVATDLPLVTAALLRWLAGAAGCAPGRAAGSGSGGGTVVPVDGGGRRQPLCARWSAADLRRAVTAVDAGRRAVSEVVGSAATVIVPGSVGGPGLLADVDEPADLVRLGLAGAGAGLLRPGHAL